MPASAIRRCRLTTGSASSVTASSEKTAVTRTSSTAAAAPPGKSKTVNICR